MTERGKKPVKNGCNEESKKETKPDSYIQKTFTEVGGLNLSLQMQRACMVVESDIETLVSKEKDYGDSWKKRGGIGAFMMLARKWDRIENCLSNNKEERYDIFHAMLQDLRDDGVIDDIRDLRRYLLLVESEVISLDE